MMLFADTDVLNTECQYNRRVTQQTTNKNYLSLGEKSKHARNRSTTPVQSLVGYSTI